MTRKNSNTEYLKWISVVKERYRNQQIKASIHVNSDMLEFYWDLGKDLHEKQFSNSYGSGFFNKVSADLRREIPDAKGFSEINIRYMARFYKLYAQNLQQVAEDFGIGLNNPMIIYNSQSVNKLQNVKLSTNITLQQVAEELFLVPWGHHMVIIDKCSDNVCKALFYVQKTIQNSWSRATLLNFLDTDLYEREGKAVTNFKSTLPAVQGDLAQQITKDPYNFDFLTIRQNYDEKELKDAIMDNIQKFLLELGEGFAFVGREVRIMVGKKEKFMDMLFYNIKLHCYVVLEVKVTDFDSTNMGQLGTYIVAVNHLLKGENDNPTIGLVVCRNKDNVEAQYALESSNQPVGVSAYELSKLIPENFKSSLPTIEKIEEELKNSFTNNTAE